MILNKFFSKYEGGQTDHPLPPEKLSSESSGLLRLKGLNEEKSDHKFKELKWLEQLITMGFKVFIPITTFLVLGVLVCK